MSELKWRLLQAASIVLAIIIIYNTFTNGLAVATSGHDVDVLLYVVSIFISIALVGLSVYFSIKSKKR